MNLKRYHSKSSQKILLRITLSLIVLLITVFNLAGCNIQNNALTTDDSGPAAEETQLSQETPVPVDINSRAEEYNSRSRPVILCYHGIAYGSERPSEFVTHLDDFIGQISLLRDAGYDFIPPSEVETRWKQWVPGKRPFAIIIFDDALESIVSATCALSDHKIPFGVAIIGQRHRRHNPEPEFASWEQLKVMFDKGTGEPLCHTYNLHHLGLGATAEGKPWLYPPFHAPQWHDHGQYLYIKPGDQRPFWDHSFFGNSSQTSAAWAIPFAGTDYLTGDTITGEVEFTATSSFEVGLMRLWLSNSRGSEYDISLNVSINNTPVAGTIIGSPWPNKEFYTIIFDEKYPVNEGERYTITLETTNEGAGELELHAIPDFSTDELSMTTSATGRGYPAGSSWPARAAIILADGSGSFASHEEYSAAIEADLKENLRTIQKYLGAEWAVHTTGYTKEDPLQSLVLAGTYEGGALARTVVLFQPEETFTAEVMRVKYTERIGEKYALIADIFVNGTPVARFAPHWHDWHWQEIDIEPYDFIKGDEYEIEFVTLNQSPVGEGLVRLYMKQDIPGEPVWNPFTVSWVSANQEYYEHRAKYEVKLPQYTDVWPSGIWVDSYKDWHWEVALPYTGPGKPFIDFLSCTPEPQAGPNQIVYPYGAYFSYYDGTRLDVHPTLRSVMSNMGISVGYTINPEPMEPYNNSSYTIRILPRLMINGAMPQADVLQEIQVYGNFSS